MVVFKVSHLRLEGILDTVSENYYLSAVDYLSMAGVVSADDELYVECAFLFHLFLVLQAFQRLLSKEHF